MFVGRTNWRRGIRTQGDPLDSASYRSDNRAQRRLRRIVDTTAQERVRELILEALRRIRDAADGRFARSITVVHRGNPGFLLLTPAETATVNSCRGDVDVHAEAPNSLHKESSDACGSSAYRSLAKHNLSTFETYLWHTLYACQHPRRPPTPWRTSSATPEPSALKLSTG